MKLLRSSDLVEFHTHPEVFEKCFGKYFDVMDKGRQHAFNHVVGNIYIWFPRFAYEDKEGNLKSDGNEYINIISDDGTEILEYCKTEPPMNQNEDDTIRLCFGKKHGEEYKFYGVFKSAYINEPGYSYLRRIHKKISDTINLDDLEDFATEIAEVNEAEIMSLPILSTTEKETITKARIGQGYFRDQLMIKYQCRCAMCGLSMKELLIASHIKEWSESDNTERIDPNNGLLLCTLHDSLFDKHLISFEDNGDIKISQKLNLHDRMLCNIRPDSNIKMSEGTRGYMSYHRSKFNKIESELEK